ncbi:MAG: hypothetical protein IKF29_00515 [Oceanobacillus sp.]|nr:hypothetical protein [Oceanobacillus sp.]
MQWGIRKEDPKDELNKKIAATAYLSARSTLSKSITDDLIRKMELDPVNSFTIVIDDFIRITIDYGVLPGGPIKMSAKIENIEARIEVTSGMMVAEKEEDIQPILEKILGTAYLLRK